MGRKGAAFFGNKARHQIRFALHKQLDRLVRRDFFVQNRLADPNAAIVDIGRHIGSQKGFFDLVYFNQFFRVVEDWSLANYLIIRQFLRVLLRVDRRLRI